MALCPASFLLWSWGALVGSDPWARTGRKARKKARFWLPMSTLSVAPPGLVPVYACTHTGVESILGPRAGRPGLLVSSQIRAYPCAETRRSSAGHEFARILRSTAARLHTSRAFPAPKGSQADRHRSRTRTSSQDSPETPTTRPHDAPGPAPLRRGRPPRRPEEVDARDHTSDGAGTRRAKAADGGPQRPEGAREAE